MKICRSPICSAGPTSSPLKSAVTPPTDDPTESYLPALIAGNMAELVAGFAGEPLLDDPLAGHVAGAVDFQRFAAERRAWLEERSARVEPLRSTRNAQRTVAETLLHLHLPDGFIRLPVAVVGERGEGGWLKAIRVYHSLWPLLGEHRVRPALLKPDPERHLSGAVADYQRALASGDVDAIVNTFESDGYFREPAGGEYLYQGLERLREFMSQILLAGGITLEHCTVTDDGLACAIEFNAVAFGKRPLVPQAGVAVYERGASGRLYGARVYDDVNVEAYAGKE
jgi:SnoaL-like domain